MSKLVLLDTGPLGLVVHPYQQATIRPWLQALAAHGFDLVVPEISDYELRRELILNRSTRSIRHLDQLVGAAQYLPITTAIMRDAAELWAQMRKQGTPTADRFALDGDVILAAQSRTLIAVGHDAVIATTNVGHLDRMVPAKLWDKLP